MSNGLVYDPESKNYNQFVKLPVGESAEKYLEVIYMI